jgi:hypothetical protein
LAFRLRFGIAPQRDLADELELEAVILH